MPVQMIFILALLLLSGFFHMVPGLTRPDLFFAVTVAREFRRTAEAARILLTFRAVVWVSALAAIALALATGLYLWALLILSAGFVAALVNAHRQMLAHAAAPSPIVEVDLSAPPERLPGGWVVAALPVLLVAAAGFWAGLNWDRLPERFPVHWGLHGADRWVATTPATVFAFLALYACLCLLLALLAWGLLHWSRRISPSGPGAAGERDFRRRVAQLSIAMAYLLVCPAWFALFQPSAALMNAWVVGLAVVVVAFTVSLIRGGQGGSRAAGGGAAPVGDRTPDACWKWGLVYINPADPSILVEKRFGIGYTLNLGNRRTWLVLALTLIPLAAGVILLHGPHR